MSKEPIQFAPKAYLWIGFIRYSLIRPLTRWERFRAFLAGYYYEIDKKGENK